MAEQVDGWSESESSDGWPSDSPGSDGEGESQPDAGDQSSQLPQFLTPDQFDSCDWWRSFVLDAVPKPEGFQSRPLVFESACAGWMSESFVFKVLGGSGPIVREGVDFG